MAFSIIGKRLASNIQGTSNQHPVNNQGTSIEHPANNQPTSREHPENIQRTSSKHPGNNQGTSREHWPGLGKSAGALKNTFIGPHGQYLIVFQCKYILLSRLITMELRYPGIGLPFRNPLHILTNLECFCFKCFLRILI